MCKDGVRTCRFNERIVQKMTILLPVLFLQHSMVCKPASAQRRPAPVATRPATKPAAAPARRSDNSVNAQQARARGFALDMSMGGPDADDADFRESA